MDSSLEAVALLTRSENRARALAVLVDRSCDRSDLAEALGVSRVTAQWILDDLVERGWATESDCTYRATDSGSVVSDAFESLLDVVGAMDRLAAVVPWFPPSSTSTCDGLPTPESRFPRTATLSRRSNGPRS